MSVLEFDLPDEGATEALGRALAEAAPVNAVFALVGELGAGKTHLVKGMARALGLDPEDVTSPTFTLIQEYPGERTLYHVDLYRIEGVEQTEHIGIDELFEAGGLCAVEWADKFPGVVPEDAVRVELTVSGPTARKVRIVLPEPFDPEREAFYKAIAAMTPNNGTREARV